MATIMEWNGVAWQTKSGGELNWLEQPYKGMVTVNLLDGSVLSTKRVGDEVKLTKAPAGSATDHERGWPSPPGENPPRFITFYPDDPNANGYWVGYRP